MARSAHDDQPQGATERQSLTARTKDLCHRYDLRAVKSLGQNFLLDENLARKIANAALAFRPEALLEIGPGLGAITLPLAESGLPLEAWEKDPKLAAPLGELLADYSNVALHIGDFLDAPIDVQRPTVAVGNLPYYITTPILERLLEARPAFVGIVVTVQKEVADRLRAAPGSEDYSSLTVYCRFFVERVETVASLPPSVFMPRPGVDSEAVALQPRREPPEGIQDASAFFRVVRAGFGYRRKTLRKALTTAGIAGLDRESVDGVLGAAGIDGQRRGETLDFGEFAALGNALARLEAGQ
ncbi:MAG: ribosomal RNA small subunit methyltransferase A [Armatimonadetes bacterium]|nr:ribosomal RNA small subunit methyltransferase A [Armatimonadota bacterium]